MEALKALGRAFYGRPYLLLTLTMLTWGANANVSRLASTEVSPMVITALRWAFVMTLVGPIVWQPLRADWPVLRAGWLRVLAMAAGGFTAFNTLFYIAGQTTTAVNIGMIQGIMPALVVVGSFLAFRTPISRFQVLGLLVAAAGVAVTVSRGNLDVLLSARLVAGDGWILLASICYAAYSVSLRRRPAVSPLAFFGALAIGAFLTSLPLLAWEIASGRAVWPTPLGWALILFTAIFPSTLSQLWFMRAIEMIGPSRAGPFINLVPIFASILAVLVLGETFAPYHALAMMLVLGGIWLAERGRPAAAAAPEGGPAKTPAP